MQNTDLTGVVLAGGNSSRMGKDKSQIHYRGVSHEIFTAQLLNEFCSAVYISKKNHPEMQIGDFQVINDIEGVTGPLGAIYSAVELIQSGGLLVLACDIPLIKKNTLESLVQHRARDYHATCIRLAGSDYLEPLMAIYESSCFDMIREAVKAGWASPTKLLANCRVKELVVDNTEQVFNANTPEDELKARDKLEDVE